MPVEYRFFLVIVAKLLCEKKIEKKKERKKEREKERKTNSHIACVTSVSAGVRRECWDESKKEARNEKGGGDGEKRKPLIPYPPPSFILFCCRSNFGAITLWETLATPANEAQDLTTSNDNSLMIYQAPMS